MVRPLANLRNEEITLPSLRLLGGFEARLVPGEAIALPKRKSQALLAYLAVGPSETQLRDTPSSDRRSHQLVMNLSFGLSLTLGMSGRSSRSARLPISDFGSRMAAVIRKDHCDHVLGS